MEGGFSPFFLGGPFFRRGGGLVDDEVLSPARLVTGECVNKKGGGCGLWYEVDAVGRAAKGCS